MAIETLIAVAQRIDIPARELTGTPEQQLKQLEDFLAQLQAIRLVLDRAIARSRNPAR